MDCAVLTVDEEEGRVAGIRLVALGWGKLEMGAGQRSDTLLASGKCYSSICFKKQAPEIAMRNNPLLSLGKPCEAVSSVEAGRREVPWR